MVRSGQTQENAMRWPTVDSVARLLDRSTEKRRCIEVRRVWWGVLLAFVGGLVSCAAPLPPGSLDPTTILSPKQSKSEKSSGSDEEISNHRTPTYPTKASQNPGHEVWMGRYQDSRGGGEIALSLVRRAGTLYGVWQLRTGGGGLVQGTVGEDGTLSFRMDNAAPECPGTFKGQATVEKDVFRGVYEGNDCEGKVSDGRLELGLR